MALSLEKEDYRRLTLCSLKIPDPNPLPQRKQWFCPRHNTTNNIKRTPVPHSPPLINLLLPIPHHSPSAGRFSPTLISTTPKTFTHPHPHHQIHQQNPNKNDILRPPKHPPPHPSRSHPPHRQLCKNLPNPQKEAAREDCREEPGGGPSESGEWECGHCAWGRDLGCEYGGG